MTTNELVSIIKLISDILKPYGETPLEDALVDIKERVRASRLNEGKVTISSKVFDDSQIHDIASSGVENILLMINDPAFRSKNNLAKLAKELSIPISNRNSTDTIIYTIQKYFERQKMDSIIRNERNNDNVKSPVDENSECKVGGQ